MNKIKKTKQKQKQTNEPPKTNKQTKNPKQTNKQTKLDYFLTLIFIHFFKM